MTAKEVGLLTQAKVIGCQAGEIYGPLAEFGFSGRLLISVNVGSNPTWFTNTRRDAAGVATSLSN